ncbi:MAG: VWA domain-containing protein [Acidobacteriota bacterium]|nr:VWA domain-containing protein [Acidobacteriota bacterium]
MIRSRALAVFGATLLIILASAGISPASDKKPSAPAGQTAPGVIQSESNLVLVNVVVTGKKKQVLKDLAPQEFHVFEDGAEQKIVSFTREADLPQDAPGRQRYMVLFFDNASTAPEFQMTARQAALKFIEMTASPDRLMAVVNFDNGLHVVQNFTSNSDLLAAAVRNVRFAAAHTSGSSQRGGGGHGGANQADMALRNLLEGVRNVANTLGTVPGRKVILFFSAGFTVNYERQADLQATVDALNKANVGVYPVGVMGVANSSADASSSRLRGTGWSTAADQQVFHTLASRTGGFPVMDTNDLLGGMQAVSKEMGENYILGYVPPNAAHDGSYHKIRVKVDRPGAEVRSRDGYVDPKGPDLLGGKPEGKTLEAHAESYEAGDIAVSLSAPYFYIKPGVALVDVVLSVPGTAMVFAKQKGVYHTQIDVLGVAYRDDNSVAARFSDSVKLDYNQKTEEQQAGQEPFEYERAFQIAPGSYLLKVVLSAGGEGFGKFVTRLAIDPFSGNEFILGGPVFGEKALPLAPETENLDHDLLENTKPLIANGVQITPSATNRFAKDSQPHVYVEVYNPLLKTGNVRVAFQCKITDLSSHRVLSVSDPIPINAYAHAGTPLVPVSFKLPTESLSPGKYQLEIWGRDSAGNVSASRTGIFSIQ